ncbi:hypothetical protein I541_2989 [Mycobacteroides abscessus]|nr:hypothetical protein I541_5338 [Mycobacteroides abscessus]EUA78509.1 hypothetical protein I541_2989 [Mycobacteroides abscessus]
MVRRFLRICHKTIGTADVGYVASDADGTQENEDVETSSHRRREEGMPPCPTRNTGQRSGAPRAFCRGRRVFLLQTHATPGAAPKQCGRAGINHTTATHPIHLTNHTGIRHHNRNIRSSCCAARIFWA